MRQFFFRATALLMMCFSGLSYGLAKHTLPQSQAGIVPNPLMVKTPSGWIRGCNQEGSMAFLGIPYAKVQRFMPPLPVDPWDTVRVCNHWGPQAMQMVRGRQLSEAEMSEKNSCVLNVWTTERNARKPVMVWLHGGGFDSGTSAWNPGMALAQKDVVVVSVNHRLNILGFLDLSSCSEQYRQSGNVGMLDIVAALQWVRDNISLFGGDPGNVTIFGESGGGGKVGSLLCMPAARGLFHKTIIMSGTILNVNTKQMSQQLGEAVLSQLGIDREHIERINDVPYNELYAAGQRAMATSIGTRQPGTPMMWGFGPTPDGETMLQQPFQPGFAAISDDIPILIGTTFNELQRLYYDKPLTAEEARVALQSTFGDDTEAYVKAFGKAYPHATPQDSPVTQASQHGHELKFCFNTLHHAKNELPSPTEKDLALADLMSSVWAAFAHTGNPNVKGLPKWKPYTAKNGEMMVFDYKCRVRHNPDRSLQQIINKHCFRQLDEFRKNH